ncbi:DUF4292 domain-containing protein [Arenibacter sp. BSSL-BM3]|uniref:DUF4292 domain-containing protein n=1 Tax=Arenibacter arenosicollis TaxID=2762274 RepID=A0ABR7QIG0_9FLAO|nr:DUF4292 domain-containing protein [Arenibacter arenosicollis]MBC8766962.1 DUF4292 domain-containing protein [Arenibacter arenosicollis]
MINSINKLQKWAVLCIFVVVVVSCKSTNIVKSGAVDENLSAKAVIRNHYYSHLSFKTLSGKMRIDYSDGETTQSVSVSLRMEKDKAIWLSAPLGIVKAYITPERVSFYNKMDNEFFDGNFSYLSQLLGTDLDFQKVQNLLLGEALFDLREEKYTVAISNDNYQLKPKKAGDLFKTLFQIEPVNYKMVTQQLSQPWEKRLLEISYKNYQKVNKWILPGEIDITALDGDHTNNITVEFRNMEFNRALNFPYNIPNGFKEIVLN